MADILDEELHHFGGLLAAPLRNGACKWFCDHPRAIDTDVFISISAAGGEFATMISRFTKHGQLDDSHLANIHLASAVGPIGIVATRAPDRFIEALNITRHWHGFARHFLGEVLSEADIGNVVKGATPFIGSAEDLAPVFGWTSFEQVAPNRAARLKNLVQRYGGTDGPRRLLDIVPRATMKAVKDQAVTHAKLAWRLAEMRKAA